MVLLMHLGAQAQLRRLQRLTRTLAVGNRLQQPWH